MVCALFVCLAANVSAATPISENENPSIKGHLWYTQSFWDNVFVGASFGGGFRMSSYDIQSSGWKGQTSFQYSVHAGKWFSPVIGAQVDMRRGRVSHFDANYTALSMDFLFDICSLVNGYDEQRLFTFVPLVGVGCGFSGIKGSQSIAFTYGFQGRFNVAPHVDLFAEARGDLFGDKIVNQALKSITNIFGLQAGISYKIHGKAFHRSDFDTQTKEVVALNDKVNELYAKIAELEQKENMRSLAKNDTVGKVFYKEPVNKNFYIYIRFAEFSSYFAQKEKKNIESIGEWMKNEPLFRIKILAFSDNLNDKAFDNDLRQKRANAIKDVLVNEYLIDPARITITAPEEEGYENKTDCSAMIVFIPEQ